MKLADWMAATSKSKFLILIAPNILMRMVGMPLGLPPAIMSLGPVPAPLATAAAPDPAPLGLILIISLGMASGLRRSPRRSSCRR